MSARRDTAPRKRRKRHPRATVRVYCEANREAGPHETIIQFRFPNGKAGRISFECRPEQEHPTIVLYRMDAGIKIAAQNGGPATVTEPSPLARMLRAAKTVNT